MPDEQVNACAAKYFRPMPDHSLYASFAGLVEGAVNDEAMTDEQRIAEIRAGLAALDLVIAERRALVTPHGPVKPPYGSPERAAWDAAHAEPQRKSFHQTAPDPTISPELGAFLGLAPVACSPECQAQPEERPCLDSCPAQRAARGEL
jgi:hypothetical protein